MIIPIKQLKQNDQIIVPQTTAEAVLVKKGSTIITLNNALDQKIESVITPINSDLETIKEGLNIIIKHKDQVEANNFPSSVKIQFNSNGHIVKAQPLNSFKVVVNQVPYIEYNGNEDQKINLGDDFKVSDTKIGLNWIDL